MWRIFLFSLGAISLSVSQATGAIVNGDFENGTSPWKTHKSMSAGENICEPPARVPGSDPAVGGHAVAELGPNMGNNGCDDNRLYQTFNCGAGGMFCTVTFKALYPQGADGEAYVNLGPTSKRIPATNGWHEYSISTPGCGTSLTVAFSLLAFGYPEKSLRIDNVTSACTAADMTSGLMSGTTAFMTNASDPDLADLHDVPKLAQVADNDCGPTAAASCLTWWKNNGFPQIAPRMGNDDSSGMRNQLASDAMTDPNTGTDLDKLTNAMNRMVDEAANNMPGPHKGELRARGTLAGNDIRDFTFLDNEFGHGEDILMLVRYMKNGKWINHYVTIRKVTGTGTTRLVSYMDPADGQPHNTTVTKRSDRLNLDYKIRDTLGNILTYPGTVVGFITMSPTVTVHSTTEPVTPTNPDGGKHIHYTIFYPPPYAYPDKLPKDLHIQVSDCDVNHYTVSGLPAGWQKQAAVAPDGKCYLTFFKDGSMIDIPSGTEIVVIYSGSDKVKKREQIITPTTSGVADPAMGALPKQNGYAVVSLTSEPPLPGGRPREAVFDSPSGTLAAILVWDPSLDPSVTEYAVFNNYTDQQIGLVGSPFFASSGLEPNTPYSFSIRAVNAAGYYGDPTEPVFLHRDELAELPILTGGPQTLEFPPPLMSFHSDNQWLVSLPGASTDGQLIVHTIKAKPEPPHPTPELLQETFWHLTSTAPLTPGPISIAIPYSESLVFGPESLLQVQLLDAGVWTNVTSSVDTDLNLISATLPHLGTVVLVNSSPPVPAVSTWGAVLTLVIMTGIGGWLARRRMGCASQSFKAGDGC